MWLEWLRSPSRAHTSLRRPAEPPSPRHFSCSSFKNINVILLEEQNGSKSQPQTPRRPSIFHRVRIASPLLRNHSKTFIISPCGEAQWKMEGLLGFGVGIWIHFHSTASKKVRLPAVFLGGKYVGGAEEIKEMNESGELSKLIGLRYVLCAQCNGSHKIYSEKHGFRTCTSCNVNGLINGNVNLALYPQ
ncbi:hypothetical protein MANES_05G009856v8 [Manihot esculenta]|uniref:Uncharacterized protein n=1 Tax=Manihot esculenta TaxID=3983 RepID=A0ACC8DJF3_MANES|nr:hypothetical protein MANES_05G009856v8 [Manihot esculenta]